jgi:hypothetical protein
MKNRVILLAAFLFFWGYNALSQGCSQCKLLSEQGSDLDESSFGSNINIGILFLMVIPYLILMFLFREQIKKVFLKVFAKKS